MRLSKPALALTCATFMLVLAAVPCRAQGILNTERFQLTDVEGTHASIDLSVSGALGNTRLLNASLTGIVGRRADRHWIRVIGGGRFLADRERKVVDDRFAQLRYSYAITPVVETFEYVQIQANRSLLLERRWLVGGGLLWTVARSEATSFRIGSGVMYEEERRDRDRLRPTDEPRLRTVRLASHVVLSHRLPGGAELLDIAYIQPSATSLANLRLLNDFGLSFPLAENVGVGLSAQWRHDSRPPAALKRDDLSFRTGISIDIR